MIFSLFSISAVRRYSEVLTGPITTPSSIIEELLNTSPSSEPRRGYTWLIGNLRALANDCLYFRFGREASTHRAYYDEKTKSFIDTDDPEAPNTHIIIDLKYQVLAIAKNARLNLYVSNIARILQNTLNSNIHLIDGRYEIEISPIYDPEDILTFLKQSYKILSITFEVGRRNNWDANRDVQVPLAKIIELAKSKCSTTTLEGDDIDRDVAEGIARSVSARGRDFSARGIRRRGEKVQTKTARKTAAQLDTLRVSNLDDLQKVSEYARQLYLTIRSENQ